jgi:hypothetical protein
MELDCIALGAICFELYCIVLGGQNVLNRNL